MYYKRIKRTLLIMVILLMSLALISGCSKKKEDTEKSTVLTIDEAKTVAVGDDYEKIIVQASGAVLENGTVDEVIIEPVVGNGEVTLNNIRGKLLDVQGGGTNSIYLQGSSTFEMVEAKRAEGPVRIYTDNTAQIDKLTITEGSQDVIVTGRVDDMEIEAPDVTVTATDADIKSVSISGANSILTIEEGSEVEKVVATADAEGSRVVVNGTAKDVTVEGSDSEVEINGAVDVLIVTGKSNIIITAEVREIRFMAGAEDSTITVAGEGVVQVIRTETSITTIGEGTIESVISNDTDNVTGEITPEESTIQEDPFTDEEDPGNEEDVEPTPATTRPSTSTPSKPSTEDEEPVQYTVTFLDYDGSIISKITVESGAAAKAPANPSMEGYTFIGWDKDFSKVTSNLIVRAEYEVNRYTVTFLDHDGKQLKQVIVNSGTAAEAPANPSREGYTFVGWDKDFSKVTSDLTVKAEYEVNEYTVTFNTNGGSAVSSIRVVFGEKIAEPADPTRANYKFAGWFSDEELTRAWDFDQIMPAKDLTLYAKWDEIGVSAISVDKETTLLEVGDTEKLTATVLPADATNKTVIWSSSDE